MEQLIDKMFDYLKKHDKEKNTAYSLHNKLKIAINTSQSLIKDLEKYKLIILEDEVKDSRLLKIVVLTNQIYYCNACKKEIVKPSELALVGELIHRCKVSYKDRKGNHKTRLGYQISTVKKF